MSPDRRGVARTALEADVVVACGTQFFSGKATDLSERGVFVVTRRALGVGDRVCLELSLPDGQVLAHGIVRWRRCEGEHEPGGIGIELEELSEVDRRLVAGYCRTRPRFITYDEVRATALLAASA